MDLTERQNQKIKEIAKRYHLKLILLFGSQVKQKFLHKESDIDIAFLPSKELDFEKEYHLNYEFTNIFSTDRVDTVNLRKAPPLLLKQIFQNHKILFCDDLKTYYRYRIYAFRLFIEAVPLFKLRDALIKKYFAQI